MFFNYLYKLVATSSVGLILFLLYLHLKQKQNIHRLAHKVTQKVENTGAEVIVHSDNSIGIYMEGDLVKRIDASNDHQIQKVERELQLAGSLLEKAIVYLVRDNKEKRQGGFYK